MSQNMLGDKAQARPGSAVDATSSEPSADPTLRVSQDVEAGSEVAWASQVSAGWPQSVVSKALREQPALHSVAASMAILDQIGDAVFIFARTGEIVMVNEPACRMLGYEREKILGRSPEDVFSQIENPPLVEGLDLRQAMSRFAVPPFDTALKTASGHSIEVSFRTSFLLDEQGDVIGVLGIARDIRERRRLEQHLLRQNEILEREVQARTEHIRISEARHRLLLEQISVAIVCADPDYNVTSVNPAAKELLGWTDTVIGAQLFDARRCKVCGTCLETIHKQDVWVGECAIIHENGSITTMFHTCSTLYDDDGQRIGTVHAFSDLSDPSAAQHGLMRDSHGLVLCDSEGLQKIVTCSDKMREVLDLVATCANTSATVLIEGESGTGKDLVAQAFHLNSDRASGPYLVVNCATLDGHFLKSEFFGHERGAFTGAVASKQGLLEVADGGTLFIDEVGDMSLDVQAMMLRVLETGRFRRMGSAAEKHVNVRIIAATNKDLEEEVGAGRFRQDLFYRLYVIRVLLPSLRERREDVPLLAAHFLRDGDNLEKNGVTKRVSREAMEILAAYAWPGNVRELKNVMEHARIMSKGSRFIGVGHLPQRLVQKVRTTRRTHKLFRSLTETEKVQIRQVLEAVGGNRTKAAEILGISRTTLISKIRK